MITVDEMERALDYIRDKAEEFGEAAGNRTYLEDFSKALKARLMANHLYLCVQKGEKEPSIAAQERYAYSHSEYIKHLEAIQIAVAEHEKLRFMMKAAEVKVMVWQCQESTRRKLGI